jgi:hypothetical protein
MQSGPPLYGLGSGVFALSRRDVALIGGFARVVVNVRLRLR